MFPDASVNFSPLSGLCLSGKAIVRRRLRAYNVLQVALLTSNCYVNERLLFLTVN